MFQRIDLRAFVRLLGPERAFVSLYCSGREGLKAIDARERKIRALLADVPDEAEHFDQDMAMVRSALEDWPEGARGRCLFARFAPDLLYDFPLPVPVPDLLRVDASPYIRPLAELQDEREGFLIVAADNKATRILQVTAAEVGDLERIKGDVKNEVKVGGWSQQRYARRRDKRRLHYAKEVADVLDDLCRRERFDRIVLLGSQETLREIEGVLSNEVAGRVVGSKGVDLRADDRSLLDAASALSTDEERESEARLWDRIRGEALAGGLAASGADDVLKAVAVGRADAIVVARRQARRRPLPGLRERHGRLGRGLPDVRLGDGLPDRPRRRARPPGRADRGHRRVRRPAPRPLGPERHRRPAAIRSGRGAAPPISGAGA